MALAEKYLAALIEEEMPKQKLLNYYVYCLCSDADIMEGVAQEAASIAGNFNLSNLIVLYDSNDITLDGKTTDTYSEDTVRKFMNMGWEVDYVGIKSNY